MFSLCCRIVLFFDSSCVYCLYNLFYIQVSLRSRFDGPSQMLILPTTFEPGDEAAFTFRVFSRTSGLRMKVKHNKTMPFNSMGGFHD